MRRYHVGLLAVLTLLPAVAEGAIATYVLDMRGAKEVAPTVGDSNGLAIGTITLNDLTGAISWNINYFNLDPTLSGFHIHGPASTTQNAGVLINLGTATTGGPGTLINSIVATPATVASVIADASNHYVNVHTSGTFAGGAVRDQLGLLIIPEPGSAGLAAIALAALAALAAGRPRRK